MKKIYLFLVVSCMYFATAAQNVVQIEYFIDTDAGVGNNILVPVTPSMDGAFSFNVDLSSVSPGYHKLYMRTKDSNGKWSQTARRNIEVLNPKTNDSIVAAEYFIDTDPGVRNATPIKGFNQGASIPISFTANTSALTPGYHKLYIRTMDVQGRWSQTVRRNLEIIKADATVDIVGVEYFFNSDPGTGSGTYTSFATPLPDGTFSFTIPRNLIPNGIDTLYMRVKDSTDNKWSQTQWIAFSGTALPLSLLEFNGTINNNDAVLNWETANEINASAFIIERSLDGHNFDSIGTTRAYNTAGTHEYNFSDAGVTSLGADAIYYRLKQKDIDGQFSYSRIVVLSVKGSKNIVTLYPNPVHDQLNLILSISRADKIKWQITDAMGKVILHQEKQVVAGGNNFSIRVSNLSSGVYFFTIKGYQLQKQLKFFKQ